MLDQRSTIAPQNLQAIIDASASRKVATLAGQQQYSTPPDWARFLAGLLPSDSPDVAFDPQCAGGNLFTGFGTFTRCYGFEIDRRILDRADSEATRRRAMRVITNCVKAWDILDEVYPDLRFECQVANPPFGIPWKLPDGTKADSTEHTWRKLLERATADGYGYFIGNWKTLERLGIATHPWVYLYQKLPAGLWKQTEVEVGIVHWWAAGERPARLDLVYETLDTGEHRHALQRLLDTMPACRSSCDEIAVSQAFEAIALIALEEQRSQPPFNIWMARDGKLRIHLSTRTRVKRRLSREDVERIGRLEGQHPLSLVTEVETRRLLRDLVECGFYTIAPEAVTAIQQALREAETAACPIMPVTDFEKVAYADELDYLECIAAPNSSLNTHHSSLQFTPGRRYPIRTAAYEFEEEFKRKKLHHDEETGSMYTEVHTCSLKGQDRFIEVRDDTGALIRFMDRPRERNPLGPREVPEAGLWSIFKEPPIRTVAEVSPVGENERVLSAMARDAGFRWYPGQLTYLSRVLTKPYGLVAADTGCGKTLMALATILFWMRKDPGLRALIIAPQGTIRGADNLKSQISNLKSTASDPDDEDAPDTHQASQWRQEIETFAPGTPCYELFSWEDYEALVATHGELPPGIYISYYEAMFRNGARESLPASWDHDKLCDKLKFPMGPTRLAFQLEVPDAQGNAQTVTRFADELALENPRKIRKGHQIAGATVLSVLSIPVHDYTSGVGEEKGGIRCILQPSLAMRIGHLFGLVALDEAHTVCNLDAQVTQALIRMEPRYRWAFTATPIPNIVSDMFPIMGWLAVPGWHEGGRRTVGWPYAREDFDLFQSTFLSKERDHTQEDKSDGRRRCVKISPVISSPARLLKLIKPTMAYISKEMCNPDLVSCRIVDVRVPMGGQQARIYGHFLNRENVPGKMPLVRACRQIAYLRNICADPVGSRQRYGGPPVASNLNPKTVAILELVRDMMARGEQFVIISSRLGQTNTLERRLAEAGIECARIDTTVSGPEKARAAGRFKAGEVPGLLMGIRCAMGYSFPKCPNLIIGSLEYSYGPFHQAIGRVWRVNSQAAATIYCVLHKGSIEETMFDAVATKKDAATICLHGERVPREFKPVDLAEVLAQTALGFDAGAGTDEEQCTAAWPVLREALRVARGEGRGASEGTAEPAAPESSLASLVPPDWKARLRSRLHRRPAAVPQHHDWRARLLDRMRAVPA